MEISKVDGLIYIIRGERVMMDRFSKDFMFQLTSEEALNWKSQIVTSNFAAVMGLRKRPLAFAEVRCFRRAVIHEVFAAFRRPVLPVNR
jgi:hypothetical protein